MVNANTASEVGLRTGRCLARFPRLILLGCSLAACLAAAPAGGIIYVVPSDDVMVDRTPIIVFGEVRSVMAAPGARLPSTDVLFEVRSAAGSLLMREAALDEEAPASSERRTTSPRPSRPTGRFPGSLPTG